MDLQQNIEREEIIDIIVDVDNYEYAQISSLLSNSSISSWDLSSQSDMDVDMNSEEDKKELSDNDQIDAVEKLNRDN